MEYLVIFEKGDTSYGAYVPDLPGCIAVGKTMDEVRKLIAEAIEFHIEGLQLAGEDVPKSTSKSPVYKTPDETSAYIEAQVPL
ncbi:type II toxin-antitoxin system HicB family antitoxin [Candidatus Poribacteria bacterium]|nr:type II toxin-antitoxin system HicB family antitoxin [Candidatus Poribacteria bacterium]